MIWIHPSQLTWWQTALRSSAANLIFWHIVTLAPLTLIWMLTENMTRLSQTCTRRWRSDAMRLRSFIVDTNKHFHKLPPFFFMCLNGVFAWLQPANSDWERWSSLGRETIQRGQSFLSVPERWNLRSNWLIWHWLVPSCVSASCNHRHNKGRLRGWPLRATPSSPGSALSAGCTVWPVLLRFVNGAVVVFAWDKRRALGEMDGDLIVSNRRAFTRWAPGPGNCNSH